MHDSDEVLNFRVRALIDEIVSSITENGLSMGHLSEEDREPFGSGLRLALEKDSDSLKQRLSTFLGTVSELWAMLSPSYMNQVICATGMLAQVWSQPLVVKFITDYTPRAVIQKTAQPINLSLN